MAQLARNLALQEMSALMTKPLVVVHIEDVPVGCLFYYPELGDGLLVISARYEGQSDRSTRIVPLSGTSICTLALQAIRAEVLSGLAVLVDGFRAEVDLSSSTNSNQAAAYVGKDGTYIRLKSERSMMEIGQCLRLDDGVIRSSPPTASVGFSRWRIVSESDPSVELWSSDLLDREG